MKDIRLSELSVEKALLKAKSHAKKGEVEEAQKLYQAILQVFPKNKRAQQGLAALNKPQPSTATQGPPQEAINQLINLYNQGQLKAVVEQAQALTEQYPEAFFVWNLLGVANKGLGLLGEASHAFKRVTELKPTFPDGFNNLGVTLQEQGKLDEAIEVYNTALIIRPDYVEAHFNLGIVLQAKGKLQDAIAAYTKTLSLKPDYAEVYYNVGNILKDQSKAEEAIGAYDKALSLKSDFIEAYFNLGVTLQDLGRSEEAIEIYAKTLLLQPDYAEVYNNIGVILQNQGKLNDAIKAFKKTLSLKADHAEAYNNMGIALQAEGRLEEAIEIFKMAVSIKPDYANAYGNMGFVLKKQGKLEEAIGFYNKAISLKPDYAEAYFNLGVALQEQGKFKKAIGAYSKTITLKPDNVGAYKNMGVSLQDQGKLDKAIEVYYAALSIQPNCADTHKNLSFALLNIGRLKEGLDEYEWRFKTSKGLSKQRSFKLPLWDGEESLKGKRILIWSEQGVGDTINWCSLLSWVASQVDDCILECQEKLVPLLVRSFPDIVVKPEFRGLDKGRNDFDFHIPMGSLYRHFLKKTFQEVEPAAFLIPDPVRVKFWEERLRSLGTGSYVGISWKSSDMSPERLQNYAPISEWAPLFKVADVTFINLQYKNFSDDLIKIQNEFGVMVHNFDDLDHFNNLDDVAALCAALDVVVSIKNTIPLISAGVGTLTKLANWRQSPWNNNLLNPLGPSVEIFQRNTWEPWENIFSLIAEEVKKHSCSLRINEGNYS